MVHWIDTSSLSVEQEILPRICCPDDYVSGQIPAVLSNGNVLFIGDNGFPGVFLWNRMDHTITLKRSANGPGMRKSADGSKVLIPDNSTAGGLTLYDAATDSFIETALATSLLLSRRIPRGQSLLLQ